MATFKKMVLVPIEEYERLKQKPIINPTLKSMGDLETEMQQTLVRPDLGDDDKNKLFQQLKERFSALQKAEDVMAKEGMKQVLQARDAPSDIIDPVSTYDFKARVPANYHRKLSHLLDHVSQHPNILSWNNQGELVLYGNPVAHTNIGDLVRSLYITVRDEIPGRKEFLLALSDTQIPHDLLSSKHSISLLSELVPAPVSSSQSGFGKKRPHKALRPPGKRPRILRLYRI